MSEGADVKIGISLDTSKLPGQVKRAEEEIKGAVDVTTEAIEAQGAAAEETAAQLEAASSKAAALQRSEAAGMKQLVGESARAQRQLARDTREGMESLGKQVSASMKGAAGEITAAMKQTVAASMAAGKQVSASMEAAAGATGGLATALGMAKGAMDVLTRGFAIIGLFNQVVATIKMVMEWWQELQKETISAGQKVANQWRLAREEAANTARMRAPHESLQEQIALNDRLLEQMRERNAFEAEMAQMKAESAGNRRGVQRAILDGQLARGEISSREHLEGYRRLEDAEREEAQAGRMQGLVNARDEAQAAYDAQVAEHRTASRNLREGVQGAMRAGILNQGGVERREYWEELATKWADANEAVGRGPATSILNNAHENAQANREYARVVRERAALRDEILRGAQYMGISATTTEDGKQVYRNMAEVAAEVMREWDKKRGELRGDVNTQTEEENAARTKLSEAQARVDELERTQAEEDRGVLQRRAQEDATLAHRADAAADKAEATAEAGRVEQARREERSALQAGKAAEEAELQAAQGMLANAMQMLKERASAEQQPAVAALEALLARAEREPEVLGQIEALMRGGQLSVTDDQNRRYGNQLRLVGNSGLDASAVLGVLQLLGHVAQRQGNVDGYGERLETLDKRDADAAEEQRRQRVRDQEEAARGARRHADAEAEAARRSRSASGAAPLEGGVFGALSAGADAMNAQGELSTAAVAAMGAFNSTATALAGTAAAQAGQIAALRQGQVGLQQQIANINRNNIC